MKNSAMKISARKISIVTATFNREREIVSALGSVAEQSWPDIEHVLIDGGSSDGTLARVAAASRPVDVLVSEPDQGIYDALNKGVARSTGEVIGLLHSDDVFAHRQVLERVAAAFEDPGVDAVYGDLVYVSRRDLGQVVRRWRAGDFAPWKLRFGWMPPHPALFLRRRVYETVGAFDLGYRIAADYDFILRAFSAGIRARYLPEVLVKMRLGGVSNAGLGLMWLKSSEDWRAARRAGFWPPAAVAAKNVSKLPQFVSARFGGQGVDGAD